jgi:proton-translocating NADH-quinone oxidoreductase chain M
MSSGSGRYTRGLVLTPLLGARGVRLLPRRRDEQAGVVGLWVSRRTRVLSLPRLLGFDRSASGYQYVREWVWPVVGRAGLGVDGISVLFVRLTTRLRPICLLSALPVIRQRRREFYSLFLLREARILVVFRARDLLLFYVSFEAVLIPRFLLIGVWGSRERKVRAANRFFLYTLFGSVWRLLALLLIYFEAGSRDLGVLRNTGFSESRQRVLWLAFFIGFAVKVPRLPFHIWLPEAHVESPTAGSVVLAALLLKFGLYAFIRRSLPLFPAGTRYFAPLAQVRAIVAVVYTSLTARRQTDRKRIIAYSSVAHRNLGLLGVFSCTLIGLEGAIYLGLSHGVVSGALFLCVGVLYDRYHTRAVSYYGGLARVRPRYVATFRLFTRANIGLPGTSSFVGEWRVLLGTFLDNRVVAARGATGRILGGGYSLWLLNRVAFGNLKRSVTTGGLAGWPIDRSRREARRFLPLVVGALVGGIYATPVLDRIQVSCSNVLEHRDRRLGGDSSVKRAAIGGRAVTSRRKTRREVHGTQGARRTSRKEGLVLERYFRSFEGRGAVDARKECLKLGLLPTRPYNALSAENRKRVKAVIQSKEDTKARDVIYTTKKAKIGRVVGIRRRRGLPARGQRTRTNASTAKRLNAGRIRSL